jgi:hypothetical protein
MPLLVAAALIFAGATAASPGVLVIAMVVLAVEALAIQNRGALRELASAILLLVLPGLFVFAALRAADWAAAPLALSVPVAVTVAALRHARRPLWPARVAS